MVGGAQAARCEVGGVWPSAREIRSAVRTAAADIASICSIVCSRVIVEMLSPYLTVPVWSRIGAATQATPGTFSSRSSA